MAGRGDQTRHSKIGDTQTDSARSRPSGIEERIQCPRHLTSVQSARVQWNKASSWTTPMARGWSVTGHLALRRSLSGCVRKCPTRNSSQSAPYRCSSCGYLEHYARDEFAAQLIADQIPIFFVRAVSASAPMWPNAGQSDPPRMRSHSAIASFWRPLARYQALTP